MKKQLLVIFAIVSLWTTSAYATIGLQPSYPQNSFLIGNLNNLIRSTSTPFFSGFTFNNATGTQATTTSLFSTKGTFTNLFAGTLNLTNLIYTNATGTNSTTTNTFSTTASSTNLFSSLLTVGGDALVVDSGTSVGIGTSVPTEKLEVSGGLRATRIAIGAATDSTNLLNVAAANNGTRGMLLRNSTNNTAAVTRLQMRNNTSDVNGLFVYATTFTTSGLNIADTFQLQAELPGGLHIRSKNASAPIVFATNDIERARITQAGLVGIGTTTPNAPLTVQASTASIQLQTTSAPASAWDIAAIASGNGRFDIREGYFGLSPTARFTIAVGGNVGVGSTTPWAKFSVTNTTANPSFVVEDSSSPDQTPFIIDSTGNVGIGTTTPTYKLSVEGSSSLGNQAIAGYFTATSTTVNSTFGGFTATRSTTTNATTTTLAIGSQIVSAFQIGGVGYATSTAWTGSTTPIQLPSPFFYKRINAVQCYTDVGTVNVDIYHTTTHLPLFNASTTQGVLVQSEILAPQEKWYLVAGTPVSSPTSLTCAIKTEVLNY